MGNRLKLVLESVISSEQSGFSPGRSIYEGIILAHEAVHSIRMAMTEKMMVKVDIRKAYDEEGQSRIEDFHGDFILDDVIMQRLIFGWWLCGDRQMMSSCSVKRATFL
ncbi:uncharacterized protein LOC131857919 [Cryptomeria japonica]|uniref:uncharacterized protein LOC131857919 n=1 Tax=Cryptomeria japonica TaxID=3369 RepID=UPI0027DA5CDF|nr:uncharacterized protein LOC131857919 [Cryptomeria japonica]